MFATSQNQVEYYIKEIVGALSVLSIFSSFIRVNCVAIWSVQGNLETGGGMECCTVDSGSPIERFPCDVRWCNGRSLVHTLKLAGLGATQNTVINIKHWFKISLKWCCDSDWHDYGARDGRIFPHSFQSSRPCADQVDGREMESYACNGNGSRSEPVGRTSSSSLTRPWIHSKEDSAKNCEKPPSQVLSKNLPSILV